MKTSRPRNITELASLVVEAAANEPEHPDWTREDYEADLTMRMCGDGTTTDNPGLLSAQIQAELALLYSGHELFFRQLDALADLMVVSEDLDLQTSGTQTKSWLADCLGPYDRV